MDVSLHPIKPSSRSIVHNLFAYYLYDMSEFMGWNPDCSGRYRVNHESLNLYWRDRGHWPYFIHVDDQLAGFFLVREYPANRQLVDVDQFFLLRKFRRQGVGIAALHQGVRQHPGQWQIRVLKQNLVGLKFWRSAVTALVGPQFDAGMDIDVDLEMHFIRFHKASER
jgi:predicted acetyltransferase